MGHRVGYIRMSSGDIRGSSERSLLLHFSFHILKYSNSKYDSMLTEISHRPQGYFGRLSGNWVDWLVWFRAVCYGDPGSLHRG